MAQGKNTDVILLTLSGVVELVKLVQAVSDDLGGDPEKIAAKIMESKELSAIAFKRWKEEVPPPPTA